MLDTVILTIPKSQYGILKKERWSMVSATRNYGAVVCRVYVNNATKQEAKNKIYRPRLTVVRQLGREEIMKIEFSAQTLLFGHTMTEASENDFENELDVLQKSLLEMGVETDKKRLSSATVPTFHPAKNILITGGYSALEIVGQFAKINLTEKMQIDCKDYKNGGHGVQFRAETHALTFYDKTRDLEKTETRSYSKDQKIQQASLFDFIEQKKKPDILRMEVRLCDKQKIKSVMARLGFSTKPTFADIFKKEVSQKILQDYFQTFIEPSMFVFDLSHDPQAAYKRIVRAKKNIKPKTAIYLAWLWEHSKNEGVRPLRRLLQPTEQELRNWQRISKDLKYINTLTTASRTPSFIKDTKEALRKFEPYRVPNEQKPPKKDPLEFLKYPH